MMDRASCLLSSFVVRDEGKTAVAQAFLQGWSVAEREAVRNASTDQPNGALSTELLTVFPASRIMALDPMHLAMVYEQPFYHKKTSGSWALRHILAKRGKHRLGKTTNDWSTTCTPHEDRHMCVISAVSVANTPRQSHFQVSRKSY